MSSSTVPGGDPLIMALDNNLGLVPGVGALLIVELDVVCGGGDEGTVQCMGQTPDPTGQVTQGLVMSNGSAVPEPATVALLGGGIAAIALRRRAKRS